MTICAALIPQCHAELVAPPVTDVPVSIAQSSPRFLANKWTLNYVQGDGVLK